MRIPVVRGVIERRILVNYRIDSEVLAKVLPSPFRPKIVHDFGIVGICLIRLAHLRPKSVPKWIGLASENAAHRAAVEWDDHGTTHEGVYIWRRDTNSRLTACVGGRFFPGIHHHSRFRVTDSKDRIELVLQSDDSLTEVLVRGRETDQIPATSVFTSLSECSRFFENGSLGYSAMRVPTQFQGLELHCQKWLAAPLAIEEIRSSYFDDEVRFPKGSIEFDCALIMRNIDHEWHAKSDLCCLGAV